MTKIVLVGPVYPYRGGIAHYTSHLANHLKNCGVEVKTFSFRRQYPQWLYPGESDRDPSLQAIKSDASYDLDPLYPWTWEKSIRKITAYQPDLVLLPWWTTFWGMAFGWMLFRLKKKGVRTAVLIHNVIPHEAKPWDRLITKTTLTQSNNFIVQTQSQKERLLEIHPLPNIRMAPHPVYDQFPGLKMETREAREKQNLPEDKRIVLFMGIIRKYKGLHQLVDSIRLLRDMNEPIHLVIAGEFWDPIDEYQEQIKNSNLEDHITIIPGYIPNEKIPVLFSACDLLAAPYKGGTQSGVVKLAMGFGLPVLISKQITDDLLNQYLDKGVTITTMETPEKLATDILAALNFGNTQEYGDSLNQSWDVMINQILSYIA